MANPPRVSLCVIARDEEKNLPRCLGSVQGLVDEIVLVDTGSSDRTVELATAAGARVVPFAWVDDFAAAKNYAVEQATGDWVLNLDADEALDPATAANLRRLVALPHDRPRAFVLPVRNYLETEPGGRQEYVHYAARLFSRHPRVRFHRPIHEEIAHLDGDSLLERVVTDDLAIEHFGYQPAAMAGREKESRNLGLLARAIERQPGDPYLRFLLGRERYVFGDLEGAAEALYRAVDLAGSQAPLYVGEARAILVAALNQLGRLDEALQVGLAGLATHAYADLHYNLGSAYLNLGLYDAAANHYRQALAEPARDKPYGRDRSITVWRARFGLGEAHRMNGDLLAADEAYQKALAAAPDEPDVLHKAATVAYLLGQVDAAIGYLKRLRVLRPDDVEAAELLAECYRAAQRLQETYDTLYGLVQAHPEDDRLRLKLASFLSDMGEDEAAVEMLSAALDREAANADLYERLGLILLKLGRKEDAMNAFVVALSLDPNRPAASAGLLEAVRS